MIAGSSLRKQQPVGYLAMILGTLAVLAIGVAGGIVAAGTTSSSSVSNQTVVAAPVTSDHLRPAGPR
jgi:hypothetical protein